MGKKHERECVGGADCFNEDHLCKIAGKKDFELIRKLVRDAQYYCKKCGRASHEAANLCKPSEI